MVQTYQIIPTINGNLWVSQSTLYSTNSAVFYDGPSACLIDPGLLPFEIMSIINFLDTQHLKPEYLLITHSHWDHLFGPEYFPYVRVITQSKFCDDLSSDRNERIMNQIQTFDRENQVRRIRSFRIPSPDITFEDTITIQLGEMSLNLMYAPGHSSDQFVVYESSSKILWAADMLSDMEIPFVYHSLTAYQQTLEKLEKLEIQQLIPGHGQSTSSYQEIKGRFKEDKAYLDELGGLIQDAIRAGKNLEETQIVCSHMKYKNQQENTDPHKINVEEVYKQFLSI